MDCKIANVQPSPGLAAFFTAPLAVSRFEGLGECACGVMVDEAGDMKLHFNKSFGCRSDMESSYFWT